jgi:hypothetical protein
METRVCRLYGSHDIRIETQPVAEPGPGEVLVRIGAGGICGSDLHYYHDGGFGPIRVREPIILGHEVAGAPDFFNFSPCNEEIDHTGLITIAWNSVAGAEGGYEIIIERAEMPQDLEWERVG